MINITDYMYTPRQAARLANVIRVARIRIIRVIGLLSIVGLFLIQACGRWELLVKGAAKPLPKASLLGIALRKQRYKKGRPVGRPFND
ncbi:hypothetical protein [Shimia sagamensis]|uniref:hypothetical protein n=1 Tax=Shimia sagamensis TaxID=1566352 RepID=UPI0024B80C70|nr:hypothetical protein [Shimia sagamensis]